MRKGQIRKHKTKALKFIITYSPSSPVLSITKTIRVIRSLQIKHSKGKHKKDTKSNYFIKGVCVLCFSMGIKPPKIKIYISRNSCMISKIYEREKQKKNPVYK